MSLFSWFGTGRKHRPEAHASMLPDSAFSRIDSTKPVNGAQHPPQPHASHRKHERMAQREQLYGVVREAMVRAGLLSSSYKFKVLSLDAQGRQYMVMVDLAQGAIGDTVRLAEIEAMVAQTARAKYDILVSAVYWRANEHVAVGDPHPLQRGASASQPAPLGADARRGSNSRPSPLTPTSSRPAPLAAQTSRPAPLTAQAARPAPLTAQAARAAPVAAPNSRAGDLEPLQADEVAAFRQALDAGVRGEQALAAVNAGRGEHNYTLLTGFEDTEMVSDAEAAQHLSATQYGALR